MASPMSNPGTERMAPTITPSRISPPIASLCGELVQSGSPLFVPVVPAPGAQYKECFQAVNRQVEEYGGFVLYGWRIWEWRDVLIEAEFHAVWKDPKGSLLDVAPVPSGEESILFLPDPNRQYEGRQVNNIRRPLRDDPVVVEFIRASDAEFRLLNRGDRAAQHGEIRLIGAEAAELVAIQRSKAEAGKRLLALPRSTGRNDPCRCGSGRKYKKCCGALR